MHPHAPNARTSRSRRHHIPAAATTLALVGAGMPFEQWLHGVASGHGHDEAIGPVQHALRDGAAVLPAMFVAVLLALALCRRMLGVREFSEVARATAVFAPVVGLTGAVAFGLGVPAHAWLFEGPGALARGGDVGAWLGHARDDGAAALVATLPAATLVSLAMRSRARMRSVTSWMGARRRRWVLASVATTSAVVPALALTLLTGPAAADLADGPCPAGAPVRHYAVAALDVDITLNRFGDHDPKGHMYALQERVADVRAQEASKQVSIGLGDDAIQPLVVRAAMGECVDIDFRNDANAPYGLHIDGLAFTAGSGGDPVGANAETTVAPGGTRTFRYFVPVEPTMEGAHYMRPGPGRRAAVSHGLFGALVVEPEGSSWKNARTGGPLQSGWEAIVSVPGKKAFREFVRLYHEVGADDEDVFDKSGEKLPQVDKHTDAYRPGSRAINYRSEPFMHRLDKAEHEKSLAYNSYTFGDPATPFGRSYLGEPTKMRILHPGSEMFHIFHLHGGGIRWRANPVADAGFDYQDTGLNKHPAPMAASMRLDSQAFGPGEAYNLEIEGGAGGVQQTVGDLLEHCHIAEHYNSGMWEFWRVFNTRQPDLEPLPDRAPLAESVSSRGLIGHTMPDGTTLTAANIDAWISALVPPRGVPKDDQDASVWNWKLDTSTPGQPLALGEPEDRSDWPDLRDGAHPGGMPGDVFVGDRPEIRFDPTTGKPAFPLLRPHVGQRAPFSPAHSGTPYLGSRVNANKTTPVDPYAKRPDGLCPSNAPSRQFGITSISLPIQVTRSGKTDPTGMIFVLNQDKAAVRAGTKPAQPLAIRANQGDCVNVNFTTEIPDAAAFNGFSKNNMHIHHVQFDIQGSDGASAGFVFDQSIRPYRSNDVQLTARGRKGDTAIQVASAAKFQPGVWIGVGEGENGLEVHQIASISGRTLRLKDGLKGAWPAGTWVGVEFQRYQWYPDVNLDNVFWHDHVDGIHGWGKGLVSQLIVEPPGSTYHDPRTGAQVDSGTIVDIHTSSPLVPGVVTGSFREMALWTIDDNPARTPGTPEEEANVVDSTLNLRAEPWADRLAANPDPSVVLSSFVHGDPNTPLPKAYPNDPFVVRTINVSGNGIDTLHIDGHTSRQELRHTSSAGQRDGALSDTIHYGISERYTRVLEGGAGGPSGRPGDYLYMNGIGRRFTDGAWGVLRVLPNRAADLKPLPGRPTPANGPAQPTRTNQRPPEPVNPGLPCPAGAPKRTFDVSAIDLSGKALDRGPGIRAAFVPTPDVDGVQAGTRRLEPLVLHAAEGECIEVTVRNQRAAKPGSAAPRVGFHVSELERTTASSGVDVGFGPEQTIAGGQSRLYRYFAPTEQVGGTLISDMGEPTNPMQGLYGMLVVAPRGSAFRDPATFASRDIGEQVMVLPDSGAPYRDVSLLFADDDEKIGDNKMPYPHDVNGKVSLSYGTAGARPDSADTFRSGPGLKLTTPFLQSYVGDRMRIHVGVAAGSEQSHLFGAGGAAWPREPFMAGSELTSTQGMAAWEVFDVHPRIGLDGGLVGPGDVVYGDVRRPFTEAGLWGLLRVLPATSCSSSVRPLPGGTCDGG
ncbi:MAG: uncharacterized protein JWM86_2666 [Thermoleophilia bacterium]|nr:uncharacterized protein [Thermoleophilia bacterium]